MYYNALMYFDDHVVIRIRPRTQNLSGIGEKLGKPGAPLREEPGEKLALNVQQISSEIRASGLPGRPP